MSWQDLKQEGIEKVKRTYWQAKALTALRAYLILVRNHPFTIDQFRQAIGHTIPEPHHPNAWGAMTNAAASARLIRHNGEYAISKRASAHGRIAKVWVRS